MIRFETKDGIFEVSANIEGYRTPEEDAIKNATPLLFLAQSFWTKKNAGNPYTLIKESILKERGPKGYIPREFTANLLFRRSDGRVDIYVFPAGIEYNEMNDRLSIGENEFTKVYRKVDLPDSGWQVPADGLMFHPEHGFPMRTIEDWPAESELHSP